MGTDSRTQKKKTFGAQTSCSCAKSLRYRCAKDPLRHVFDWCDLVSTLLCKPNILSAKMTSHAVRLYMYKGHTHTHTHTHTINIKLEMLIFLFAEKEVDPDTHINNDISLFLSVNIIQRIFCITLSVFVCVLCVWNIYIKLNLYIDILQTWPQNRTRSMETHAH